HLSALVYVILAECRLILAEAQAPQPDHDVLDSALFRVAAHHRSVWGECPGGPKRPRIGGFCVNWCRCPNSATLGVHISQCQAVPGEDRKLCQISLSDQRAEGLEPNIAASARARSR